MESQNEALFSDLFSYRFSLIEYESLDEDIIIEELKYYLIGIGTERNMINAILIDFYNFYGIDVMEETIINIPPLNPIISMFSFQPVSLFSIPASNQPIQLEPIHAESVQPFSMSLVNMLANSQANPQFNLFSAPPANSFQQNIHNSMINVLNLLLHGANPPQEDVRVTMDDNDFDNLKTITLEQSMDQDCTICLCSMDINEVVIELDCNHTFHKECIEKYFKEYSYKCPLCRKEAGKAKYDLPD